MGKIRKNAARRRVSGRRQAARRGLPASALLVVLLVVAATAVFFAFLPLIRDAGNFAPSRSQRTDLARPDEDSANTARFAREEKPPEAADRGETVPDSSTVAGLPPEIEAAPVETPPETPAAAAERPPETRERGIYLVLVGNDGADLLLTRVSRTMAASTTPLRDSLDALLRGPTAEEAALGKVSFIPGGARIISTWVEGHSVGDSRFDTAYINFSDDFSYNTMGSEGLRLQLMQVVWTATEFANVRDVQILIEGNRVEFLHEGVPIGSPIGRTR